MTDNEAAALNMTLDMIREELRRIANVLESAVDTKDGSVNVNVRIDNGGQR